MTTIFAAQQDFGTDNAAYPDLDPSFSLITGNRVIQEIVLRRLTTQRGTVVDDPDFGCDIRAYLNAGDPGFGAVAKQSRLYEIKSIVESELVKDQRISSCTAVVTFNSVATSSLPANCLHLVVTINPNANPFTLELAVTSVTLALLKTG